MQRAYLQLLNGGACVYWSWCCAADQLASDGAFPSEKVEQSADGREQAPPRREHRMDDATAGLPLRQDVDKTPGADVFPDHDGGSCTTPTPANVASRSTARSSVMRRGRCGINAVWPSL